MALRSSLINDTFCSHLCSWPRACTVMGEHQQSRMFPEPNCSFLCLVLFAKGCISDLFFVSRLYYWSCYFPDSWQNRRPSTFTLAVSKHDETLLLFP